VPGATSVDLTCEWLDGLDRLRAEWSHLALAGRNVFSSWEWSDVWLRHFGAGEAPALLGLRRPDGELAAILPLATGRRGPLRIARLVGHGPADQLGPVCAAEDRAAVATALAGALGERGVPRLAVLERLDRREGWVEALGARVLHREPSPVLDLRGRDWEEYLAGRSSNFRSQVRRAERKLVREHGLEYRLCDTSELLQTGFDALVELHEARWGDGSQAFDGALEAFHREFAAVALERGWLRLWLALAGERPIGAWYGFRYAGVESFYQAGRDPEWERSKVGMVLLAQTIRAAFEDGMDEYRFLRGGETYKSRFTDSTEVVETAALSGAATARLAVRGAALLASTGPGRRLVSGLAG